MAKPTSKAELKEYCLRRLGKPVLEINVSDDQVDDAIDYTLQKFQQFHYDGCEKVYLKHLLTQDVIDRAKTNTNSTSDGAYLLEAYIEDANGFRGDGDMFSKFGVRISDQVTFIISRTRFTEVVDDNHTLIVEGRPNEGDLIHFPLANKTFEIQFVEHEIPFYQLGKIHVWGLRCELFEYSDEDFDTGVAEVDAIELNFANAITVTLLAGGSGDFTVGETVTGGTSNTTADVKSWDAGTGKLIVINRDGRFTIPETITGDVSSASWTSANYNTINNVNTSDTIDTNQIIETQADGILDFTEVNPFGEFGNSGGTL